MKMLHLMVPAMLALTSATAMAQPEQSLLEYPRLTVSYDDVNISSPRGAEIVLGRIVSAARQVCGANSGVRGATTAREILVCVRFATEQAVRQINAPQLTSLFQRRAATNQIAMN